MYKITNITKAVYNGKKVKMFMAWEAKDGRNVFAGRFTAPAKTANKNLGNYITE